MAVLHEEEEFPSTASSASTKAVMRGEREDIEGLGCERNAVTNTLAEAHIVEDAEPPAGRRRFEYCRATAPKSRARRREEETKTRKKMSSARLGRVGKGRGGTAAFLLLTKAQTHRLR